LQSIFLSLARGLDRLARTALWLAAFALVAMTALIFWQVFTRYVIGQQSMFTDGYSVLMMGWFIFLGAAVGTREGHHLSFDILLQVVPRKVSLVFQTISDLLVAAFGAGMVIFGWQTMVAAWSEAMPLIGLPAGVTRIPIILGGAMIFLFSLERVALRAAGKKTARFADAASEEQG
jgi:TRAP-type C4-dicarboxylate transport system permease small subunit